MPLHFSRAEFANRLQRLRDAMAERRLDGLLLFNQASRYWLTGYDSFGFVLFDCLVVTRDGALTLLTRPTDVPAARHTSNLEDIRIWKDGPPSAPIEALMALLAERGLAGQRVGVEFHSFGLTARYGAQLSAATQGRYQLVDASELVAELRVVKSNEELVYVRKAAELTNTAFAEACRLAIPGGREEEILARAQGIVLGGGGDYPGNEFTVASGRGALLPRYFSGRRTLDAQDQLLLQIGGAYRRYHAAVIAAICVGGATQEHRRMHKVAADALTEARKLLAPGKPLAAIYQEYQRIAAEAGYGECTLSACGYSLGAAYHPTWMDWPWIHPGSEVLAQPGSVYYIHMVLLDPRRDRVMALGDTCLVTPTGCERLTTPPFTLIET